MCIVCSAGIRKGQAPPTSSPRRPRSQVELGNGTLWLLSSEVSSTPTTRISGTTPELRSSIRTPARGTLDHRCVARRATRGSGRSTHILAGCRRSSIAPSPAGAADTCCLPLKPLQGFAQQKSCDAGEDNGRDRFPNQSLHELIDLGVGHRPAQESNSSARSTGLEPFAYFPLASARLLR